MHLFFRSIGFPRDFTRREEDALKDAVVENADRRIYTTNGPEMMAMFEKDIGDGFGIAVVGCFDENESFTADYMYPYVTGKSVSTYEDVTVERHADRECYSGVCEDIRMGISVIFYLRNIIPYIRARNAGFLPVRGTSVTLTGLGYQGSVIFPLFKLPSLERADRKVESNHRRMLMAARNGDEKAMENLAYEEMELYSSISSKLEDGSDVLSIVDTTFMPYGVECDQYEIMGIILTVGKTMNLMTEQKVYRLSLAVNGLLIDICIAERDLYGVPRPGRRFRGSVWLQGMINFPEKEGI